MKKIVIAGGSGFLGKLLIQYFMNRDYRLTVLSRKKYQDQNNLKFVEWDGYHKGDWVEELSDADVLINLCGFSVNCRYNDTNKQAIYDSRLDSTLLLGEVLESLDYGPTLWLNASSATIYRHSYVPMDENAPHGEGFSVDVCEQWENAFYQYKNTGARQIALRMAMVFDAQEGGAYDHMKEAVRLGFGGGLGQGSQYVSWIHGHDFCRAIEFLIKNVELEGDVNISSPFPIINREMMAIVAEHQSHVLSMKCPEWLLSIGSFIKQTEKELVVKSRCVIPKKLNKAGFKFHYPRMSDAANEIASRQKAGVDNIYGKIERWVISK